jgi:hypothetical protein
VIIAYLNVKDVTFTPPKTDAPLLVNPNAVLTLSIALQSFELIRTRNRKVFQIFGSVELLQLAEALE